MAKKFIILTGCLLFITGVNLGLLLNPKPVTGLPSPEVWSYRNLVSQKALENQALPVLNLVYGKKQTTIPSAELNLWQKKEIIFATYPRASLANYFYFQTGTTHPWTSYEFSAKVMGLGVEAKMLGGKLLAIAQKENRQPQDALLEIIDGRAVRFAPEQTGQTLDLKKAQAEIVLALLAGRLEVPLPFLVYEPKIKLLDLNNLGINEHLATGGTDFSGSSASRIQNIRAGSSRYNGIIVMPGEEFAFNKHLGPIDAAHGFKPELVIKPEGTVPEFGGGLCQVSSTAFRAALFAGLPITERRNHSYAVRYYEWIADDQPRVPGLDATIYPGAQDLKFINDTPSAILIWTRVEGPKLYFDFYGTKDNREVIIDGPHPYDRKPDGAVKSKVIRKVIKSGEIQEVTFSSRYVSPNLYPKVYEYPKTPTTTPLQNN